MARATAAVVSAFTLWSLLWIGFAATLHALFGEVYDPTRPLTHTGALLVYIGYSVLISAVSGWVCAAIAGRNAVRTVWVYAVMLLLVGIGFEVSAWALTPAWYHIVFLVLLIPATLAGARLREARAAA